VSIADWYVVILLLGCGGGIAAFWVFALASRRVDALGDFGATKDGHIAAELLTAVLLLAGGAARIVSEHGSVASTLAPLGIGALLYAVFQSPGYYRRTQPAVRWILVATGLAMVPAIAVLITGH